MATKYTFWKLLSEKKIVIPIIQRDYAQGRKDKGYIRKGLLEQLGKALGIIGCDEKNKNAELDFVYGTEYRIKQADGLETIEMLPLDGQQRLTTLWLLHWYVAFKSGYLFKDDVRGALLNFSYETRTSSREFCENLCDLNSNEGANDIEQFITQQTWFFSSWKQDPTIQSMLRMLEGTNTSKEESGEYIDGIQELFPKDTDFNACWEYLVSDNCPIIFNFLPLQSSELPISDDLYIKMNARGKALTNFENFKSDLIDWIFQEKNDNFFGEDQETRVKYASLIDNEWTDIFWNSVILEITKTADTSIDDIYFAFLNRYFLNQAITHDYIKIQQNKITQGENLWTLYGEKSDDSKIKYQGFERYSKILSGIKDFDILSRLQKLFKNISNIKDINLYLPEWAKEPYSFHFIPIHTENGISTLTQPQRVLFYAICRYFEENGFQENSFKQWMRVVCNLIENPNIDTIDSMIGRMKLVDELSNHCGDIYEYLVSDDFQLKSNAAAEQIKEEKEKCKQILLYRKEKEGTSEDDILESENYAFFHGAIRFLFTNADNEISWKDFNKKVENAKIFFDENGIQDGVKYDLISAFVKLLPKWSLMYDKQIFTKNASFWQRIILYDDQYAIPLHNLLMCEDLKAVPKEPIIFSDVEDKKGCEEYMEVRRQLSESGLINIIIDNYDEFRFKWAWNLVGQLAMYRPHGGQGAPIMFDWGENRRNEFLNSIIGRDDIEVHNQIEGTNPIFFSGWKVEFVYKKKYYFGWLNNNWVDMYDEDAKCFDKEASDPRYTELHSRYLEAAEEEPERYFNNVESFIKELDRCVEKYEEIKLEEKAS